MGRIFVAALIAAACQASLAADADAINGEVRLHWDPLSVNDAGPHR